jgi:hypothetical protein
MEAKGKYDFPKKMIMPTGITLMVIVVIGLFLYMVAIPFDIHAIMKIYNYIVSKIVNISGLNQWLVKAIVIIALIPLLWILPRIYFGKYKKVARAIGLIYMAAFFMTLYFVSKDLYFAHSGKEILRWYALTPEGVRYYDSPGVDTTYGIPLKPVTPDVIRNLKLWEDKDINLVNPRKVTFFNPITGEPRVWYYQYPEGTFEFYDKPGYHPITGEPLKAVTKQIYFEWKGKTNLKGNSVKNKDEDAKEKEYQVAMVGRPQRDEKVLESGDIEQATRILLVSPSISGNTTWRDPTLQNWLRKARREEGLNPSSHRYEIQGEVKNAAPEAHIFIDIKTNKWWPQEGYIHVSPDGKWWGSIWLDDSHPPMLLRITLYEGEKTLVREFKIN